MNFLHVSVTLLFIVVFLVGMLLATGDQEDE